MLATLVIGAGTGIAVAAVGPDTSDVSAAGADTGDSGDSVDTVTAGADGDAALGLGHLHAQAAARREAADSASRSGARSTAQREKDTGKRKAAPGRAGQAGGGKTKAAEKPAPEAVSDPRQIALGMLPEYGWDSTQFDCLDQLWIGESNWDHTATNPTSGAYGIPQSLPAEKMAAAGPDWRTNPATQIEWGLNYIRLSYGTPCSANSFKLANNWY